MTEFQPFYQKYSHLYVYDTQTKKHILKSGTTYKKRCAQDPHRYIETSSMFPQPIPEPTKANIEHVEQKKITTQIGDEIFSMPEKKSIDNKQKEEEVLRSQIQKLIQEELRTNPNQYQNKSADELSDSFRKMLIEKLTKTNNTPKPSKQLKQPNKSSKGWTFTINNQGYNDPLDDYMYDNIDDEYDEYDADDDKLTH